MTSLASQRGFMAARDVDLVLSRCLDRLKSAHGFGETQKVLGFRNEGCRLGEAGVASASCSQVG